MNSQAPTPVKYFVAVLWKDPNALAAALEILQAAWGEVDFQGEDHPFDCTNYYDAEMGPGLFRRLVCFAELRSPEELASAKVRCQDWEQAIVDRAGRGRLVNLDVGYLDHNKIVLASVKGLGQKIYLSQGIYADLVARYGHGRYQPFEWTFPDFKTGRYDAELEVIRRGYLEEIMRRRQGG